jgi:hypothetical protein
MKLLVTIPTHPGHRRFINTCIDHAKQLNPVDITLVYDNGLNLEEKELNLETYLPPQDVCIKLSSILLNRRDQKWGGVGVPWNYQQRDVLGLVYARKPDYILSINGDCVITKVRGFFDLIEKMEKGNYDIAPCHYREDNAGTMAFLSTYDGFVKIFNYYITTFEQSMNAEGRLALSIKKTNSKAYDTGFPFDRAFSRSDSYLEGVWAKELGLIHLHGTEKYRVSNKILPLDEKYYDKRFLRPNELAALTGYWKDGDIKHLYKNNYWRE